ncbi:MAG: HmuY family protein [Myxococcaceae bacterium]
MRLDARHSVNVCILVSALLISTGCGKPGPDLVDGGTHGGIANPGEPRCEATAPTCQEQSLTQLNLNTKVNDAATVSTLSFTQGVYVSGVDASAGGVGANTSYVYVKFTKDGLQKVAIHDEAALASLDWDVAFRRFVVRLNSGVSGPSCTEAARLPDGTSFDDVTATPSGLSWRTEEYFTPTCDPVPGPSGIGDPGTALASYWSYQTCVEMTGNVYVIHLRDGRYLKFRVDSYYEPTHQEQCNTTHAVSSSPGNGAANFRVSWAFINAPAAP